MITCSKGHPEILFTEEVAHCPACIAWAELGKLSIHYGFLQKQIEKRKKMDDAVKMLYECL